MGIEQRTQPLKITMQDGELTPEAADRLKAEQSVTPETLTDRFFAERIRLEKELQEKKAEFFEVFTSKVDEALSNFQTEVCLRIDALKDPGVVENFRQLAELTQLVAREIDGLEPIRNPEPNHKKEPGRKRGFFGTLFQRNDDISPTRGAQSIGEKPVFDASNIKTNITRDSQSARESLRISLQNEFDPDEFRVVADIPTNEEIDKEISEWVEYIKNKFSNGIYIYKHALEDNRQHPDIKNHFTAFTIQKNHFLKNGYNHDHVNRLVYIDPQTGTLLLSLSVIEIDLPRRSKRKIVYSLDVLLPCEDAAYFVSLDEEIQFEEAINYLALMSQKLGKKEKLKRD